MTSLSVLVAWALALLSCDYVHSGHIPSYAGPYIAFARRFDICPSDGTIVLNLKTTHFVRARPVEPQNLWGNVSVKIPFDDSFWMHTNLAIRSNNQWKRNAFVFNFARGGCSVVREQAPPIFHYMQRISPKLNDKKNPCVLPQGQFDLGNDTINWIFPNVKVMPYGHYLFTIVLGKATQTKMFCLEVECEAIPAKRNLIRS